MSAQQLLLLLGKSRLLLSNNILFPSDIQAAFRKVCSLFLSPRKYSQIISGNLGQSVRRLRTLCPMRPDTMSGAFGHNVRRVYCRGTIDLYQQYRRLVLLVQRVCTTCTKAMYWQCRDIFDLKNKNKQRIIWLVQKIFVPLHPQCCVLAKTESLLYVERKQHRSVLIRSQSVFISNNK